MDLEDKLPRRFWRVEGRHFLDIGAADEGRCFVRGSGASEDHGAEGGIGDEGFAGCGELGEEGRVDDVDPTRVGDGYGCDGGVGVGRVAVGSEVDARGNSLGFDRGVGGRVVAGSGGDRSSSRSGEVGLELR